MSSVHPNIRRSKISDSLWSQFLFEMAEEFCQQPNHKYKKMVSCVGRQPGSSVWVLNEEVQIDDEGNLIPKDLQEYFW